MGDECVRLTEDGKKDFVILTYRYERLQSGWEKMTDFIAEHYVTWVRDIFAVSDHFEDRDLAKQENVVSPGFVPGYVQHELKTVRRSFCVVTCVVVLVIEMLCGQHAVLSLRGTSQIWAKGDF